MAAKRGGRGGKRSSKTPKIPALELGERLKQGPPAACYLLLGPEAFLQEQALHALEERLLGARAGGDCRGRGMMRSPASQRSQAPTG